MNSKIIWSIVGTYAFILGFEKLVILWLLQTSGRDETLRFFESIVDQLETTWLFIPIFLMIMGISLITAAFVVKEKK